MRFSADIVAAAFLFSATLVSAAPKGSLTRFAKGLGRGLTHAVEFVNPVQSGNHRRDLEERKLSGLLHKLGNLGKTAVEAAGGGSAVAQKAGTLVNAFKNYKRGLDESEDLDLLLRDLEQHLVERGWDEELEILRRDFGDLLSERDFGDLLSERDVVEDFDARHFEEELVEARDFEMDELD